MCDILPDIFDHAVAHILENAELNDRIGAEFVHTDLQRPILIPFRRRSEVRGRDADSMGQNFTTRK